MKKVFAAMLALLTLFSLAACSSGGDSSAEVKAMKVQLEQMQKQLDDANAKLNEVSTQPTAAPAPAETAAPAVSEAPANENVCHIYAYNCTIDGQSVIELHEGGTYTAEAIVPEGMAVYGWMFNGEPVMDEYATNALMEPLPYCEKLYTFDAALGDATIAVILRDEKRVMSINANMRFLDKKGKAKGTKFDDFIFEYDYENTATHEMQPGGLISVYVEADIPKGYTVDYWLINDIEYHFDRTVKGFTVYNIEESTVYEAVLKEESKSTSKPTPTPTPRQWASEPTRTAEPARTAEPVVYYNVKCTSCTFSGGGYSGATSGMVPAGTTITVTSNYGGDKVVWEGSYADGNADVSPAIPSSTTSLSYTVDGDCYFNCRHIVN